MPHSKLMVFFDSACFRRKKKKKPRQTVADPVDNIELQEVPDYRVIQPVLPGMKYVSTPCYTVKREIAGSDPGGGGGRGIDFYSGFRKKSRYTLL